MSEINFIKKYEKADADKKIDLICNHMIIFFEGTI